MAILNVEWKSYSVLSCATCNPSDVYLCVNPEKIAPIICPEGAEDPEVPFVWHTIEGSLLTFAECHTSAGVKYYTYVFTYDDAQLIEDEILETIDVTGAVCKGCLTQWALDTAGEDVTIHIDELGRYILTNQHGCEYPLQVGETFNFTVEGDSGTPQTIDEGDTLSVLGGQAVTTTASATDTLTIDVNISDDPSNALELDGNALFVPGLAGNVPVGGIIMTGTPAAPPGWLLCNGAAVSRATEANLFAAIGVAFGAGDGLTTFNVPNFIGNFPLGVATSGTGSTLGGSGGLIDHAHTVPAHFHGIGTGADLAIAASGSHLHTINHDHPAGTTSSVANHTHLIINSTPANATLLATNYLSKEIDLPPPLEEFSYQLAARAEAPNVGLTSASGAHDHTFDVATFLGDSGAVTHTHITSDFTGSIGLVTGGVNGNAAMTSGLNNPPFTAVNFIIKT